jgi:hypothetical protein
MCEICPLIWYNINIKGADRMNLNFTHFELWKGSANPDFHKAIIFELDYGMTYLLELRKENNEWQPKAVWHHEIPNKSNVCSCCREEIHYNSTCLYLEVNDRLPILFDKIKNDQKFRLNALFDLT